MKKYKKSHNMFENFPKERIKLPDDYLKIYTEHYLNNRGGKTAASSLSQKMETWMHRKVAQDIRPKLNIRPATLEIGAGTLNQLAYEQQNAIYDIVEPFSELYQQSPFLKNVNHIYEYITDINGEDKYDRITSVATFEHIENLPEVIAISSLLLKENGALRIAIPNEGTILWKLGVQFSGFEFKKKYGLDYSILMEYEHVNTADEIEEVLQFFYNKIRCCCFGINKRIAFYRFYECTVPNKENSRFFLTNK